MPIRAIVFVGLIIAILSSGPPARAGWGNSLGRHLGVGWGDGYHSRSACPPRHNTWQGAWRAQPAAPNAPLPWWATPAQPTEQLPTPAEPTPALENELPPPGTSLFRQPGEGSSLSIGPAH